jgi:hypothetical protein
VGSSGESWRGGARRRRGGVRGEVRGREETCRRCARGARGRRAARWEVSAKRRCGILDPFRGGARVDGGSMPGRRCSDMM